MLADFPLKSEFWLVGCAVGSTPDGSTYLRSHGSHELVVVKTGELFDLACELHRRSGRHTPIDAMGRPVDSRRAELELLAQSASGVSRMTRVRVMATKKRPKPQQINGVAAPQARRRSRPRLPSAVSVQHLVAHGVDNKGLSDFEDALRQEIAQSGTLVVGISVTDNGPGIEPAKRYASTLV